jgi:hypothetical protein
VLSVSHTLPPYIPHCWTIYVSLVLSIIARYAAYDWILLWYSDWRASQAAKRNGFYAQSDDDGMERLPGIYN